MDAKEEYMYEYLKKKKLKEDMMMSFSCDVSIYFSGILRNINYAKLPIDGDSYWRRGTYQSIIIIDGSFSVGDSVVSNKIFCSLEEVPRYCYSDHFKKLFVNIEDKCYEISIGYCERELRTRKLVVNVVVHVHNKEVFDLSYNSLYSYLDNTHPNRELLSNSPNYNFDVYITKNTNIFDEVVKMVKEEKFNRQHKK